MLLLLMVFLPVLLGLFTLAAPKIRPADAESLGLLASCTQAILALFAVLVYLVAGPGSPVLNADAGWSLGVGLPLLHFRLGVDGLSIWLLAISGLLAPALVMATPRRSVLHSCRGYYALLCMVPGLLAGVYASANLLLFFIFFELTLIPLYLLILHWGENPRQSRSAAGLTFLYSFFGSMLGLASVLYIGHKVFLATGQYSFDRGVISALIGSKGGLLSAEESWWVFLGLLAAFAVKVPLFPLHTWLPTAHVASPRQGSVDFLLVLLKLGVYGLLAYAVPIAGAGAYSLAPAVGLLAVVGVLYGAYCAIGATELRRLLAYSSVSHLSLAVLGLVSMTVLGYAGAVVYMVSYALSSGALFLIAGMIALRLGSTRLADLGGLAVRMPWLAAFLVFFAMASIGLPATSGFAAEFATLAGAFVSSSQPLTGVIGFAGAEGFRGPLSAWLAVFAAGGMILSAVYMLNAVRIVAFGPLRYPGGPASSLPNHGAHHASDAASPCSHDHHAGTGQTSPGGQADSHSEDAHAAVSQPPAPGSGMGLEARHSPRLHDLTSREWSMLFPMALLVLLFGMYPRLISSPASVTARVKLDQVAHAVVAAPQAAGDALVSAGPAGPEEMK